jgi:hypothetical protein
MRSPSDAVPASAHELRQRAKRLRHVVRGLLDAQAVAEIGRFIAELEAQADELSRV